MPREITRRTFPGRFALAEVLVSGQRCWFFTYGGQPCALGVWSHRHRRLARLACRQLNRRGYSPHIAAEAWLRFLKAYAATFPLSESPCLRGENESEASR